MNRQLRKSGKVVANVRFAKSFIDPELPAELLTQLRSITRNFAFSLQAGDLLLLHGRWYVTYTGLISLEARRQCHGIHVQPIPEFSDPRNERYAFKATVLKSKTSAGFVGYGDADPSNVSPLVRGAEMRVAETRAVNRARRKAYGIGICSVEEIGARGEPIQPFSESNKLPPLPTNGNHGARTIRDRLCQLIRQYKLDPILVKAYATDFCGTKTLREASREQVENFVVHLADWAEKDRNALLCQLNSYSAQKEGAA